LIGDRPAHDAMPGERLEHFGEDRDDLKIHRDLPFLIACLFPRL
jgi:hypothetical protein